MNRKIFDSFKNKIIVFFLTICGNKFLENNLNITQNGSYDNNFRSNLDHCRSDLLRRFW